MSQAGAPPLLPARLGPGARGGFTTRAGGVSAGPYGAAGGGGGLDLALHVGDDPAAVAVNRERLAAGLGVTVSWMDQVHGTDVAVVEVPGGADLGRCDAAVAVRGDRPLAVGVLVADCVPVLLADRRGDAVAAVHVGRRGLVAGVIEATLATLTAQGVDTADLFAAVGPAVCGRCYEVPAAMQEEVADVVPGTASTTSWGTPALDVPAGVLRRLAAAGLRAVDHVDACTLEDVRFYSYRRAGRDGAPVTGRFAGVVRTRRGAGDTPR